jgi:hypothetical protein
MDDQKRSPPWAAGRRPGIDNNHLHDKPEIRQAQATTVIIVAAVIGHESFALRTVSYIYDPRISRHVLLPYKTGPRAGQLRHVRVQGEHRGKRASIRRYRDAALAARAYHATRRALGVGLLPWRSGEAAFTGMGCAQFTAAGRNSVVGQELAARMQRLGVPVVAEPLEARSLNEFWYADN